MLQRIIMSLWEKPKKLAVTEDRGDRKNFDNFALRLDFEIHLEEYKIHQSQIQAYIEQQYQIINFSIATIGAVSFIIQFILDKGSTIFSQSLPYALLISGLIFSIFSLLLIRLENRIAYRGNYIYNILRPRMDNILSKAINSHAEIWSWEIVSIKRSRHGVSMIIESWMGLSVYLEPVCKI